MKRALLRLFFRTVSVPRELPEVENAVRDHPGGSANGAGTLPHLGGRGGPHNGGVGPGSDSAERLGRLLLGDAATMDLLESVFNSDPEIAAGALERLCEGVKNDVVLSAALGSHARFLPRLHDLLVLHAPLPAAAAGPATHSGGGGSCSSGALPRDDPTAALERVTMYAAYLVSALAGKSAAIDARLLDQRFVPALVEATSAAGAGAWGVKRGTLRALAKLLEAQPACAAAQLVACGGVEVVAGLLAGDGCTRGNCGISRRSLAILLSVARVAPGGAATSRMLHPEALAALVRLLGSGSSETQQEAAALVGLLLSGGAPAGGALARAGADPALNALASSGCRGEAQRLAAEALSSLQQLVGAGWQQQGPPSRPPSAGQGRPTGPQPTMSLQRAASSGSALRPLPVANARPLALGRAASAPLPAVPEQEQLAAAAAAAGLEDAPIGGAGELGGAWGGSGSHWGSRSTSIIPSSSADSLARVQQWHAPPPRLPPTHRSFSRQGPPAAAGLPLGAGVSSPPTSVADLLAALSSGLPRTQLAAAEQLGALAASGGRAAAVITAAGGPEALVACICESAAGPVDIQDTMADAFEAALGQSLCTAALRTLCTLVQQHPGAAAGLPPAAAAALRLLLSGPDAQQRQLAAMLLGTMQAVGADPVTAGGQFGGLTGATHLLYQAFAAQAAAPGGSSSGAGEAAVGAAAGPAWAPSAVGATAAASPSPDLLPSESQSLLSELPALSERPSTVRTSSRGPTREALSRGEPASDTPAAAGELPRRTPSMDSPSGPLVGSSGDNSGSHGGQQLGGSWGAGGGPSSRAPPLNFQQLPPQVKRQLGEQLQLLQRPPLPPPGQPASGQPMGLQASQLQPSQAPSPASFPSPAGWAGGSPQLPAEQQQLTSAPRGLWGRDSEGSDQPTPHRSASASLWGGSEGEGGLSLGRAASDVGSTGSGLLLNRSDITICKDPSGREWRLGEGGFGVVYKALMNGVDEVAVKFIKAEIPSDAELAAFYREVHALSNLRHRNLVQYYGACLEPGSMMIVTELLKGGDLYSALRRHPAALAWGRLGRKVALDVGLGLNYLHSQRPPLSHRDLKSPNVLLSEEGVAKIADVGMLRRQAAELITAQPVMTPLWSAPEVLRRERAGVKADIWSFGILVWEIVTGADITEQQPLAFTKQMRAAAAPSDQAADAAGCLVMPPDAPAVARLIFDSCTQLDPALRPNAAQLVEWLRSA